MTHPPHLQDAQLPAGLPHHSRVGDEKKIVVRATYTCIGGAKFCGSVVKNGVKALQDRCVGGFCMDVILLHVDDVKHANLIIAAKTLPGDHAGQYLARGRTGKDGARIASPYTHLNKIYIDPAIKGGRPKRIVGHEIGHWLGVGHQARNDSIMSYGYRAPSSFGAIDIERLTRAY